MKKVTQGFKVGLSIFLFVALPLVVFTLITSKTGVLGGIRSFTVLSGSMEPTLPVGSMIYAVKQPTYDLGDVVSVSIGDVVVTHRIFQTIQNEDGVSFVLKGDANKVPDQNAVFARDIIGKQMVMVPFAGSLSAFVRTPAGFILLVVVPAIFLIAFELFSIKKELEVQIEKKLRNQMGISI